MKGVVPEKWTNNNLNFYIIRRDLKTPCIKRMVLQKEIKRIMDALETLKNILRSNEFYKHFDFAHKAFEWQMKDFFERMNPKDKYVDTMHLEDPRSLQINKLMTDFNNLEVLLQEIFVNFPLAKETLEGCVQLLDIREDLQDTYISNVGTLTELREAHVKRSQVLGFGIKQRQEKRNRILEKHTVGTLVYDPICWRYMINTNLTNNEFLEYQLQKQNDNVDDQISYYEKKGELDTLAASNACMLLNIQIEDYKAKIARWSWQYEIAFDKVDGEQGTLKESIKYLKKQIVDIKERAIWYRSERERMIKEEAEKQEALLLLEQQRLQSVAPKPKKKKSVKKSLSLKPK